MSFTLCAIKKVLRKKSNFLFQLLKILQLFELVLEYVRTISWALVHAHTDIKSDFLFARDIHIANFSVNWRNLSFISKHFKCNPKQPQKPATWTFKQQQQQQPTGTNTAPACPANVYLISLLSVVSHNALVIVRVGCCCCCCCWLVNTTWLRCTRRCWVHTSIPRPGAIYYDQNTCEPTFERRNGIAGDR